MKILLQIQHYHKIQNIYYFYFGILLINCFMNFHKLPIGNASNKTVIVANGSFPYSRLSLDILDTAKRIVACDGAADKLIKREFAVSAIIGDCDSLQPSTMTNYSDIIHRYADQETNDLTKAVNFCIENDYTDIIILGATGKREDHTLANLSLLDDYKTLVDIILITDYGCFNAINETSAFQSFYGQQVSIFCLEPSPISVKNLLYPINNRVFSRWWQASLNESTSDIFEIITSSPLLVFRAFAEAKNNC